MPTCYGRGHRCYPLPLHAPDFLAIERFFLLSAVFLLSARPMATLVATESCGLIELHSQQPRRQSSWRFMSALSCAEPIADEREFIAAFLPERSEVLPPTFMWRKKDLPRPDDTAVAHVSLASKDARPAASFWAAFSPTHC